MILDSQTPVGREREMQQIVIDSVQEQARQLHFARQAVTSEEAKLERRKSEAIAAGFSADDVERFVKDAPQ